MISSQVKPWQFDSEVSNYFDSHVRQHIPDYERVIDLSVSICKKSLSTADAIVDVGSATGYTIKLLHQAGFYNLLGIDSSQDMLNKCQHLSMAKWICSDKFVQDLGPYHAVLCNWTLHFVENKTQYLQDIFTSLNPGGLLILSEKTSNHGIELDLYHEFKRCQGVTEQEIQEKALRLQNVMFIDSADWYLTSLRKLGFQEVGIVNAAPCFTTFLCRK